jgi:hypothetical protein
LNIVSTIVPSGRSLALPTASLGALGALGALAVAVGAALVGPVLVRGATLEATLGACVAVASGAVACGLVEPVEAGAEGPVTPQPTAKTSERDPMGRIRSIAEVYEAERRLGTDVLW